MAKVFISYRHVQPDEEMATRLASFLERNGLQVFIDRKLLTGQEWIEEIERQLRTSQFFVALLSAESIRSDMVRWEIEMAHGLRKESKLRILPVRVAYKGQLPMDLGAYLNRIHYTTWCEGMPFEALFESILQGIQAPSQAPAIEESEASAEGLQILAEVTNQKGAPFPSADPRLETGAVKLDSPFYVRRTADKHLEHLITQKGVTVLVKGPRQVGKTSLLARGLSHAQDRKLRAFYIDFQLTDASRFASLETLLRYVAAKISKELGTKVKPDAVWDDMLGATDSLTEFVEQAVLQEAEDPIIFAFDEVDSVFTCEFRNGFFAMIRAWHNRRAMQPVWNRLNLVIGHSTEPALFIDDINQSPFNVGEVIRLSDFTIAETERLNELNGRPLQSSDELTGLLKLLGGHPYLIRQAFYCLRTTVQNLSELTRVGADDNGPFGDHLRRLLWSLQRRDAMRLTLKQVLRQDGCESELEFQRLRAAGLLAGESRASARMRCDLYRLYFSQHL